MTDTIEAEPVADPEPAEPPKSHRATQSVLNIEALLWLGVGALVLLSSGRFVTPFAISDTLAHIVLFGGISITVVAAALLRTTGSIVRIIVVLAALAAASEIAQNLLQSGRVAELRDIVSDVIGIALGAGTALALRSLITGPRAQKFIAIVSLLGLVGTATIASGATGSVRNWWQCRSETTAAMATPVAGLDPHLDVLPLRTVTPEDEVPPPAMTENLAGSWCQVMVNNQYTVSTWVRSLDNEQWGPTRIASSSIGTDTGLVNFHVGQQFDELTIRIRTGEDFASQQENIPLVFVDDEWHHVVFRYESGTGTVFVDGEKRATFPTRNSWISAWDKSFPFLVGDELTRDRSYIGSISDTRFFVTALTEDEIAKLESLPRTPE